MFESLLLVVNNDAHTDFEQIIYSIITLYSNVNRFKHLKQWKIKS